MGAGRSPGHIHLNLNPSSCNLDPEGSLHFSEPHISAANENDAAKGLSEDEAR